MFDEYYYTAQVETPIYISIITLNNSVETTIYTGNKLAKRKSLKRGIHILEIQDIRLKVQIKWFSVILELKVNNEIINLQKLKRKVLRKKLQELQITNELNPKKKPRKPFKISSLKTPAFLLTIGIVLQISTRGKSNLWEIPSMILYITTYIYLFSSLIDRIPDRHVDIETKGKLKLLIGLAGMIFTQIFIDKVINFF